MSIGRIGHRHRYVVRSKICSEGYISPRVLKSQESKTWMLHAPEAFLYTFPLIWYSPIWRLYFHQADVYIHFGFSCIYMHDGGKKFALIMPFFVVI